MFAEHHARLGPLVHVFDAANADDDLPVAGDLLVGVVEGIGARPDVGARPLDDDRVAIAESAAGADGADIPTLPLPRQRPVGDLEADRRRVGDPVLVVDDPCAYAIRA